VNYVEYTSCSQALVVLGPLKAVWLPEVLRRSFFTIKQLPPGGREAESAFENDARDDSMDRDRDKDKDRVDRGTVGKEGSEDGKNGQVHIQGHRLYLFQKRHNNHPKARVCEQNLFLLFQ
jgi:hypothetical protein